jgi:hypothetical protein
MFCFCMMRLHCCSVLCISCWYFFVGSLVSGVNLFCSMNVCTFLLYLSVLMTTIDLLLSAWVIIALSFSSLLFICFLIYSCLLCFGFCLLLVLIICFSLFVAIWRYVLCTFGSSRFMGQDNVKFMLNYVCEF